jgi:hypothetical protein
LREDKTRAGGGWLGFGRLEGKVSEPWRPSPVAWTWRESEDGDRFESVDAQAGGGRGTRGGLPGSPLDLPPTAVAV